MSVVPSAEEFQDISFHEVILRQGELISDKLNILRHEHYPPNAKKVFDNFRWPRLRIFLG